MSIRTNPMKAVPTLLKRLEIVEKHGDFKDLKDELIAIKDLFSTVKKNEEELLDILTLVDGYLRNKNIRKLMDEKEDICQKIRNSTLKLLPGSSNTTTQRRGQWEKKEKMGRVPEDCLSEDVDLLLYHQVYKRLDDHAKRCLSSFAHFPGKAIIKERNVLLWWTYAVDSLRLPWQQKGESVFRNLLYRGLIGPHRYSKFIVDKKFNISPGIHRKLAKPLFQRDEKKLYGIYSQIITSFNPSDSQYECLVLDQKKVKLGDDVFAFKSNHWKAIFNVGASYLTFEPQWMANMKHLEVLQLGRWLHGSQKHHIEVRSEEFLKELKGQKNLKYLGLRGISGISNLLNILQLERLETLDLKACHNLETLPNDISSLRCLKHLNLSDCYLLDKLPRGIEKLTELQVLKGFVIGSPSKTPCRVSDLGKLKKLERLSIHIASKAVVKERELESLKEMSVLEDLKISWGTTEISYSGIEISLPSNLRKLHVKGFPGESIPEWLKPGKLPLVLSELCITGGKLRSKMVLKEYVNKSRFLKIVRLKYIKYLNLPDPVHNYFLFPPLSYLQIKEVGGQNFDSRQWIVSE